MVSNGAFPKMDFDGHWIGCTRLIPISLHPGRSEVAQKTTQYDKRRLMDLRRPSFTHRHTVSRLQQRNREQDRVWNDVGQGRGVE